MEILTISEFTKKFKTLVESEYYNIKLQGEISGYSVSKPGHIYLTLKDDGALINATIWATTAKRLTEDFQNGDKVIVSGSIGVYAPYGKYHIVINTIEKDGVGDLYKAYELLKQKLEKEGLFDKAKKTIPFLPKRVAILTSKDGAALTDFLNISYRRNANANILIVPVLVQGKNAGDDIVKNLKKISLMEDIDLVVLARGGGSIEELWCFNEEKVARAIFEMKKTVVSAIGHERDFTIADFVSDKRASTPSEAAEIIFKESNVIKQELNSLKEILINKYRDSLYKKRNDIDLLKSKLKNAKPSLETRKNYVERIKNKLVNEINQKLYYYQNIINEIKTQLVSNHPKNKLKQDKMLIENHKKQLEQSFKKYLTKKTTEIELLKAKINALSPLKILEKGYSVIYDENNNLITTSDKLTDSRKVLIKLKDGETKAIVKEWE